MAPHSFTTGSRVEVTSHEEGSKGACYVATIIENPEKNKYLVVYDDLMENEDMDSNHLTETVDVSDVRPLPPLDKGQIIRLYDIVDAFHLDGWWTGQVIEILQEGKFLVYFQNPPDELIVQRDHLRFHLDWVDGKWEKPIKQTQFHKMIRQGTAVEVTFENKNYNVWHLGIVLQVEGNGKFLVKYRCFGVDDELEYQTQVIDSRCIRPEPPRVEEQDFDVLDKVEAYYCCCWWTGVIRKIAKDRKYVVLVTHSEVEIECNHIHLRPRLDWIDGKWTTTSPDTKLLVIDNEPFTSKRRKTTPRKVHSEKYCGTTRKKNDAAIRVDEANMSVKENLGASSKTPVKNNPKKQMRDLENIEGSRGIKRSPKKKRGRLEKNSLEEQIVTSEAKSNAGMDNLMLMNIDNEPDEDHYMLSCKEFKKLIIAERKVLNHLHRRNRLLSRIPNISQVEDQTTKTGINTKIEKLPNESLSNEHVEKNKFVDDGSQQQDETVAQQTDSYNIKGQLLIDGPLRDLSDDQPDQPLLSGALLVADEFATATDGEEQSQKSSAVATKDMVQFSPLQTNIASGEIGTPSLITSCNSLKNEKLPFVKCSPLWKSVESMEIYRKTEQKPHFSPLLKCREETREGLAIGHMVIFSTVVEKTSKLRFSDPSSVIRSYLQTVADLEKQGFEVEPVRARLMLLLAKKANERKLEAEYKQIEDEMTNKLLEKNELAQEMTQINQKIKELAEKLNKAESRKVIKEDEISTLQSKQEVIFANVHSVKHEFESIAGCLL